MGDGTSEDLTGRAKQAAGAITDDKDLEREGRIERAEGKVKGKVDEAADKVKKLLRRD